MYGSTPTPPPRESNQNCRGLTSLAFAQLDPGRPRDPPYLDSVYYFTDYEKKRKKHKTQKRKKPDRLFRRLHIWQTHLITSWKRYTIWQSLSNTGFAGNLYYDINNIQASNHEKPGIPQMAEQGGLSHK